MKILLLSLLLGTALPASEPDSLKAYMVATAHFDTQWSWDVKEYIQKGRWHVSGGAWDASDVNVPSSESLFRNFLQAQDSPFFLTAVFPARSRNAIWTGRSRPDTSCWKGLWNAMSSLTGRMTSGW